VLLPLLKRLKMKKRILITGGAGFVGSHLADELLAHGYSVRALDCLEPQVHGQTSGRPAYLNDEVELIRGDIRDGDAVTKALQNVDAVFHLAAAVGVGQSMYQIARYTDFNAMGTAVLLERLMQHPVERLVVASSMSIYGEGLYRDSKGNLCEPPERALSQLKQRCWDLLDHANDPLEPIPTAETKHPAIPSIYALSKYVQERMCLTVGKAYGVDTVALRFFNIYGPRQSLSNPYTGVLAIFASRLLNNQPPLINEDGLQQRDFVSVRDITQACRLALEVPEAAGCVFNIGSGHPSTVRNIAAKLARVIGKDEINPEITGKYRMGDIRHCFADITEARRVLGYQPHVNLEGGLEELANWLDGQVAVDQFDAAQGELVAHGLAV
jgi:dTDP-L-rhamnose 4-epimerase